MQERKEFGALWIKTGPKGEYLSGTISIGTEKIKVVAFLNKTKKNDKEPDWRVVESVERASNTEAKEEISSPW